MIDTIYYEEGIIDHPRVIALLDRFPNAIPLPCENYKEVFNPSGQNFRLQKKNPSLILARKNGKLVLPIPETYGIGGKKNFYFSHMLNCLYDCRYCFLQGMYPSAHYVLFVNYEDFLEELKSKTMETPTSPTWFFSGYDCDSLALDYISGFVDSFLPFFQKNKSAFLELRTKSVKINTLAQYTPIENVITAFSFTPSEISAQIEHGVPSVNSRIKAMRRLVNLGWKIGLRIDPLIDCENFHQRHEKLFDDIFSAISGDDIHSISLGSFRMPTTFFKKIEKLYPDEKLFAGRMESRSGTHAYRQEIEQDRRKTCLDLLKSHIDTSKVFVCENTSA